VTGPAPDHAAEADPALVTDATVLVTGVSMWFGQKVALSELTCSFGPGVTGLLGPNGAGKTTLMRAMTGTLAPQQGTVRVHGHDPRAHRPTQARVALVPEDDAVPTALTARQLVAYAAALHRVADRTAVDASLAAVGLVEVADRTVGGFSKGMRQRAKVAAALVSGPSVLVLDEPLNGADPVQRVRLIELFQALGAQGRTVVVSSHVLHEVERLADRQIVLVGGRLAAAGGRLAIREAMADRPRRIRVRADDARRLASSLVALESVVGVQVEGTDLVVSSLRAADTSLALPVVARDLGVRLLEVRPLDESLESVFRELVR
jgi:ABC-2 type transport system ATP-binding protein